VGIDAGSPVGSGPAPFLIENNAQLRLDLQIPERLASHVRPGMAVHVEQDGRSATGRLLSLASTIDPATRALAAKASLPTDTGLIPGKSVMVTPPQPIWPPRISLRGRGAVSACRVRP
jgi:cobalt-zinc-cadmium efflux system membrane fusion protein